MTALAEADRLAALAELVGAAALSGPERVALLAGRLLRDGVLQQSALSTVDAAGGDEKAAALVTAVLAVVDECHRLVTAGVPAEVLEEFDFTALVRLREEAAPHDVELIGRRRDEVLAGLRRLR